MRLATLSLVALLALTPTVLSSQRPGTTATIAGTVVDAARKPLTGVAIHLASTETADQRSVVTDAGGRFQITGLPAGRFIVSATIAGYVTQEYGAAGPGQPGTPIVLAAAQRVADVAFTLDAVGGITGQVLDDAGKPISGITVAAGTVTRRGLRNLIKYFGHTTADDQGRYRIDDVAPGQYVVAAIPTAVNLGDPRVGSTGSKEAVWAMFAPGVREVAQASSVVVVPGQDAIGIDVRLRPVQTSTLHVTFTPSGTDMPSIVSVAMASYDDPSSSFARSVTLKDVTTVHLHAVAAGTYVIRASGFSAAGGASRSWAHQVVTVDGINPLDVSAVLVPGARIEGRIAYAGASPPAGWPRVRLVAIDDNMPPEIGEFTGTPIVAPDGRFEISGIAPGRYLLRVATASGASRWELGGATIGGADAYDLPIDILPGQQFAGATITMVDRLASLSGQLSGADGRARSDLTMVLYASDERYWWTGTSRIRTTRPDSAGTYRFPGLGAGEYRLAAVTALPADPADPDYLRQLNNASIGVTILPGERQVQDVRIQ
ncbi:MAG TPA: carboxypeptidase-like regulatory domain-containing protein [Vicinamibacterales bacterium]|nr:carboxypeptidase-like regulatory domain-containing protein [Vicinamibacterales bacterium]